MIYKEALNYIMNISRLGSEYGLDRMQLICDSFGNPEDSLKFIHVAGTNGKGSVTAYLTSILKNNGYKVGTYNSPYIYNYRERFLINGEMASEESVAKYLTLVKERIESLQKDNPKYYLTAFEIETIAAYLLFKEEKCDIVVLEVGLGGRLDATNVIKNKEVAIITPIGFDHCALLGNTLGEIAGEKAAIIKDVAVTSMQSREVMDVIEKHSKKLYIASTPKVISRDIEKGQVIEIDGEQYTTHLLGEYQQENLAISLCAIKVLKEKGWKIDLEKTKKGVEETKWAVRFDVKKINGKYIILDGSHNPHGAKSLAQTLKKFFPQENIHFVIGMLRDKDMKGILGLLLPLSSKITFIQSSSPRAASTDELVILAKDMGYDSRKINDINEAIKEELEGDSKVIVVCGSLTLFEQITMFN